jgi:hypothetical protein
MQVPLPSSLLGPVQGFVQEPDIVRIAVIENFRLFHMNLSIKGIIQKCTFMSHLCQRAVYHNQIGLQGQIIIIIIIIGMLNNEQLEPTLLHSAYVIAVQIP